MAPNLPTEVMRNIIWCLVYGPRTRIQTSRNTDMEWTDWKMTDNAPLYATVCKMWQEIIERETFQELRLDLNRLSMVSTVMTPRRRSYVKMIRLDVVLPRYFDAAWGQVETAEDQLQNNIVTTATIRAFIEQLGDWKKEDMPEGQQLTVWMSAYSPSDELHCTPEEMSQRRVFPRPKWRQIYEKRYENSVLELTDLDTSSLSVVSVVNYLSVYNSHGRHFAPAVVCALVGRLRNVKDARCLVWDDPRDLSERRYRIRNDYAHALKGITVVPSSLVLTLCLNKPTFVDHSIEAPVFTPSGTEDLLSRSLRSLSQKAEKLTVGNVIISDEFFWPARPSPDTDGNGAPHWPFLSSLVLGLALTTPDGRWRFDYAEPESESGSGGSDDSESDYEEINKLRRSAVPEIMNDFYRSAARAALEMPKLEFMHLSFNGWTFQDVTFHTFMYEVKGSRVTATWFSYPPFYPDEDVVECWKQVGAKYHNTISEVILSEDRPQRRWT